MKFSSKVVVSVVSCLALAGGIGFASSAFSSAEDVDDQVAVDTVQGDVTDSGAVTEPGTEEQPLWKTDPAKYVSERFYAESEEVQQKIIASISSPYFQWVANGGDMQEVTALFEAKKISCADIMAAFMEIEGDHLYMPDIGFQGCTE